MPTIWDEIRRLIGDAEQCLRSEEQRYGELKAQYRELLAQHSELVRENRRRAAIEIQARKLWNALLSTDGVLELWRTGKANKGDRGRCRHLNKEAMDQAREVLGDP